MASDFQVLNDWLDVDISFHTYFSVSSFNRIQAVTEIEQRHTIFFGVKYCEKNDKKINKFVRNAFVHAAQCIKCLERSCLYLQQKIWFSGTSISEIIYCLQWSALGWRLEISCTYDECGALYAWRWTDYFFQCINSQQKCVFTCVHFNTINALLCFIHCAHFVSFHFRFSNGHTWNRPYKSFVHLIGRRSHNTVCHWLWPADRRLNWN